MIWSLIFSFFQGIVGPIFTFLNNRVDAQKQIHIVDAQTIATITAGGEGAAQAADALKAQIIQKEGNWGPMTIMMALILAPFVWHEWQVVLDSSRWIPYWWGSWLPTVIQHRVGSWDIPALPDPWGTVELTIFQSFFIGATAATGVIAAFKALGKRI